MRTAFRRDKQWITRQEAADTRCVPKDGGAVNARRGHLGIAGANHVGVLERFRTMPAMAINARDFERTWVFSRSHCDARRPGEGASVFPLGSYHVVEPEAIPAGHAP